MSLLHAPAVSGWVRGHLLCRVDSATGRYALTFDDGPSATWTPRVLDVLARHGAHATFFMLAPRIRSNPGVVRRLLAEGHEAGLHGSHHLPLLVLPPREIRAEIRRCLEALVEVDERQPRFYRPPFGLMLPSQARFVRTLGYEPVLGDVFPEDPQRPGAGRIVERVMRRLEAGSVLILHDGSPNGEADRSQTVEALETILARTHGDGLRAVALGELLGAA